MPPIFTSKLNIEIVFIESMTSDYLAKQSIIKSKAQRQEILTVHSLQKICFILRTWGPCCIAGVQKNNAILITNTALSYFPVDQAVYLCHCFIYLCILTLFSCVITIPISYKSHIIVYFLWNNPEREYICLERKSICSLVPHF